MTDEERMQMMRYRTAITESAWALRAWGRWYKQQSDTRRYPDVTAERHYEALEAIRIAMPDMPLPDKSEL